MIPEMKICKLDPAAILPTYATAGSAGADLYALPVGDPVVVGPGEPAFPRTGLAAAVSAALILTIGGSG